VCPSVRHKPVFYTETAEQIELVFGTNACSTLCWKGILTSLKIRALFSGTLFQTLYLEKCRNCTSTVASVVNLSGRLNRCHTCNFIARFCRATLSRDEIACVTCVSHTATLSHKQELTNQRSQHYRDKVA